MVIINVPLLCLPDCLSLVSLYDGRVNFCHSLDRDSISVRPGNNPSEGFKQQQWGGLVGKNGEKGDSRPINRHISEKIEDKHINTTEN